MGCFGELWTFWAEKNIILKWIPTLFTGGNFQFSVYLIISVFKNYPSVKFQMGLVKQSTPSQGNNDT